MRVQTFSVVTGSEACNASCPFCVSKMTPPNGVTLAQPKVRWDRFEKACDFAKMMDVTTVILTGKGEPTLFPEQITDYVVALQRHRFPFVELQTNGLCLAEEKFAQRWLPGWVDRGLTMVAVSIVHYEPEKNRQVYYSHRPRLPYIDLPALIEGLHRYGVSVRLTAVLLDGWLDSAEEVERLIGFARRHGVEQLSLSPVKTADRTSNEVVAAWTRQHELKSGGFPVERPLEEIREYIESNGTLLLTLPHGAAVFDVGGQNVCLRDCLTLPKGEEIRQVIFFPDGHLRYDWQYPGAILM